MARDYAGGAAALALLPPPIAAKDQTAPPIQFRFRYLRQLLIAALKSLSIQCRNVSDAKQFIEAIQS